MTNEIGLLLITLRLLGEISKLTKTIRILCIGRCFLSCYIVDSV